MFIRRALTCLLALLTLAGCLGRVPEPVIEPAVATTDEYRLGIGDVISIRVFGGDEDLRFERIRLNDRSTLTLPFGDFTAYGRTTKEVEAAITEKLKGRILLNPRVWVNIEEYRPFFVQGQVGRPGAYPYQPGLTVRRAITVAGGLTVRASPQKIFVVREQDKLNSMARVNMNSIVGPGDTITVEESFF